MPNQNDQFPRGQALPAQSPVFWVGQKDRYLRQLMIGDIEQTTNRNLVVYFTDCTTDAFIDINDEIYLAELLNAVDKDKDGIDLLLETNGGQTDATEKVVSTLRSLTSDLRVIVPRRAKSNGTVIALTGREIVMGVNSELGPIDPSITVGQGASMPAQFITQANPIDPILKQIAEYAVKQTQKLATDVLKSGMLVGVPDATIDDIVQKISTRDHYHSHGSVIDHAEAASLGLKVQLLNPASDLWQKLWLLRAMYDYDCKAKRLSKIFEGAKISSGISLK